MVGRGRGRRAPPTGARLLLEKTSQESGSASADVSKPPKLFPPIILHSSGNNARLKEEEELLKQQQQQQGDGAGIKLEPGSGDVGEAFPFSQKKLAEVKRSAQTLFLITKTREIQHRIQNSAFHVKATKDVPDIIRHSDSLKAVQKIDASTVLSHCLRGRKRTAMGQFVPEELVSGQKLGSTNVLSTNIEMGVLAGRGLSLNDLDKEITTQTPGDNNADAADEDDFPVDEGSEDEGQDYVADYYASEGEESDGGGGEPTF